jgi:hypothetical protein
MAEGQVRENPIPANLSRIVSLAPENPVPSKRRD